MTNVHTFKHPRSYTRNGFGNVVVNGHITRVLIAKFGTAGDLRQDLRDLGEILARGDINRMGHDIKCLRSTKAKLAVGTKGIQ
jgi:hypothetical protein